jgi:hypothetical protein
MAADEWLVNVLTAYGVLGILFAIGFVTKGIGPRYEGGVVDALHRLGKAPRFHSVHAA